LQYLGLQKPLYDRRHAIISGTAQPTREELDNGEKYSIKEDEEYTPLPKDVSPSSEGIPHFWLTALRNHIALSELITDRDVEALKHLVDVQLAYLDDKAGKPGFKILFIFSANDFFENDVLEKIYLYQEEVGYSGDFVYDRAIGSEIRWKEDKDLTKEFEIKKQRNKSRSFLFIPSLPLTHSLPLDTNRTRLVRKAKPTESFFNFFTPPIPPSEEAIENGDFEDDELEEIEEKLELDYQIGEDIKEKVLFFATRLNIRF